jgi:hypothetical protein
LPAHEFGLGLLASISLVERRATPFERLTDFRQSCAPILLSNQAPLHARRSVRRTQPVDFAL